jgi:hypothetical protein
MNAGLKSKRGSGNYNLLQPSEAKVKRENVAARVEQAAPSPAALRQRRHRRRIRSGRAVFRTELDVLDVELYLVGAGLLRPGDVDRSAIEAALSRLLERLITT